MEDLNENVSIEHFCANTVSLTRHIPSQSSRICYKSRHFLRVEIFPLCQLQIGVKSCTTEAVRAQFRGMCGSKCRKYVWWRVKLGFFRTELGETRRDVCETGRRFSDESAQRFGRWEKIQNYLREGGRDSAPVQNHADHLESGLFWPRFFLHFDRKLTQVAFFSDLVSGASNYPEKCVSRGQFRLSREVQLTRGQFRFRGRFDFRDPSKFDAALRVLLPLIRVSFPVDPLSNSR